MTRDEVIALAAEKGRVIKPSLKDSNVCCLDCGPAPDTNERMLLTADGAFLIVDEGRYWQVGTVEEMAEGLRRMQ